MQLIEEKVKEAIEPALSEKGFELVDVEFNKKYGQDNLTVYVHLEKGVSLDDCEKAHYIIDPVLDELDPTGGKSYVLNVSSPGLDRPFKTRRDFERNYGKEVEVKLFAPIKGKKVLNGVLINYDANITKLTINNVESAIENTRIALVRPLVKF